MISFSDFAQAVMSVAFFAIVAICLGIVIWLWFAREADLRRDNEGQEPSPESYRAVWRVVEAQAEIERREKQLRAWDGDMKQVWTDREAGRR